MALIERRPLGRRIPSVTRVGLGGAALGNLYRAITDDDAVATVDAAWAHGVRLFDTAPLYGHGRSEARLGQALRRRPRQEYVLCTKVGRVLEPTAGPADGGIFVDVPDVVPVFDFSADGVRRSLDASLERLGVDHVDVVHVHDPDDHEAEVLAGAFPALVRLREEGVIGAVGCGMNQVAMLERFVERVDLDVILIAGRYSLLERQGALGLLERCHERGVGVLLGGVFNSGLLADPYRNSTYDYAPARAEKVAEAQRFAAVAGEHGVELGAVAVRFALAHPAVGAVLLGAASAAEVDVDLRWATTEVPAVLWEALDITPIG